MASPRFCLYWEPQRETHAPVRLKRRSEVIEEKLRDPLHQDAAGRRVTDPMASARESQNLNVFPRLDEIVNHREV